MPRKYMAGAPIVPLGMAVRVEAGQDYKGLAFAISPHDNELLYLITQEKGPPIWLGEREITRTYVPGTR